MAIYKGTFADCFAFAHPVKNIQIIASWRIGNPYLADEATIVEREQLLEFFDRVRKNISK